MTIAAVKAIREIAEGNTMYNEETKTLTIKSGKLAGKYLYVSVVAAMELAGANG